MSCEDYQELLTGYIDNELSDQQRQRLDGHLRTCQTCTRELEQLTAMKEELAMLKFKEPSDAELQRYWSSIYNRLERGVGWILFSLGAIVALCYGGVKLVEEMISDPEISLVLKIGVIALICGTVVLFVSLLRERLTLRKTDKYSREVER
jgi:anti-sigma factor RsiW